MSTPKILGREPAVLVSVIEAALALAISFGWLADIGIKGQQDLGVVMAVVAGAAALYVAYVTHDTMLGVSVGLLKALIALAAVYNLTITLEQTGALIAFLTVAIGLFQRTQTTPIAQGNFNLAA